MKWDATTFRLLEAPRIKRGALLIAIISSISTAVGVATNEEQFFFSYLQAFAYWLTIGLGGLFFVMLHHMTGARWSLPVRRLSEHIMVLLPLLAILFIPILFGLHDLYHWSDPETVAGDHLLQKKAPYLNVPFFIIRAVFYFVVWSGLAWLLSKNSLAQDKGHTDRLASRFKHISAPGLILFALTTTFASFDWLMSLDAHWYSTIFGAYIFAGGVVAFLSFLILVVLALRRNGILAAEITADRLHDLGRLLFAFTVFWAYMAFSQYFLIWYANIPEETIWFLHRWEGSWKQISLLLAIGHFVVPFLILITHSAKRSGVMLAVMASWMLFMHWVDLHWVIMPTIHHEGFHLSWLDLSAFIAVGGFCVSVFWTLAAKHPLAPVGDPRFNVSEDKSH